MAYYSPYITGWHFIPYIQQITRVSAGHCSNEFRGFWHIFLHVLVSLPRLGCAKAYLALALAQQRTRGDFTRLTPNDLGDWWLFLGIKAQERLWCFTHPDLNQISQIHHKSQASFWFFHIQKKTPPFWWLKCCIWRDTNSTHEASEWDFLDAKNHRVLHVKTSVQPWWPTSWAEPEKIQQKNHPPPWAIQPKMSEMFDEEIPNGSEKTKKQIRLGSVQYFCCFQL